MSSSTRDTAIAAAAASSSSSVSNGKAPVAHQSVPRFQRRQSERAFLEDQYREHTPTMEYPSGSSPWASSPEASRTSFSGDVPREDLPAPAVLDSSREAHENGTQSQHHPSPYSYQPGRQGNWSPEQEQHWQNQQQQQGQYGSVEENRRPQSGRYHNLPPQQQPQQRQHMPQYKLQAKITGLERSSKKDLILKFDVYVCRHQSCVLPKRGLC